MPYSQEEQDSMVGSLDSEFIIFLAPHIMGASGLDCISVDNHS